MFRPVLNVPTSDKWRNIWLKRNAQQPTTFAVDADDGDIVARIKARKMTVDAKMPTRTLCGVATRTIGTKAARFA